MVYYLMLRYIRRAGLDTRGATDALPKIKPEEAMGTVVSTFQRLRMELY